MVLTKQYLRYAPSGTFNTISSNKCNSVFVSLNGVSGRYVAVGACEHVIIWDLRLGEKAQVLAGEKIDVCALAAAPTGNHVAVGYVDGNVNIYDLNKCEVVCVFAGHKSAITSMQYDEEGHRLVTGSQDTDIILWDIVSETGIARFTGHKGSVTSVSLMNSRNCIISTSKDTYVKFWDIETKHCFKTLGGHLSEIWDGVLLKNEQFLVTGSTDAELRVWKLLWTDDDKDNLDDLVKNMEIIKLEEGENNEDNVLQCLQTGSLIRGGRGRVTGLVTDPSQSTVACFGTDGLLETFFFCSDDVLKQRMEKRIKKQKKRIQKQKDSGSSVEEIEELIETLTLADLVKRMQSIKVKAKIKSACTILGGGGELRCGVTTNDNRIMLYSIDTESPNIEATFLKEVSQCGHRADPRCVAISSDNLAILSSSADSIKLWNRVSLKCVRTIEINPLNRPLTICFAPGERHAVAGCGGGKILLLDVASAIILEEIPAHSADVWSVGLTPDQRGFFSGSGDKSVKIWQFELVPDPSGESKAKILSPVHTRTLELEESVLAVKMSSNGKFIATALIDSTVKIFFYDTFKFYLSLYGHKLPVLCLDISYDSNLIATGSADRTVKVWGMDFGDCHRSLFAHNDSVTALQFVPSTHYFFTSSKDGKIKQWDGDSFDNIITLHGHSGECWSLAVGAGGLHVVSAGSDLAIRLWSRTDEPIVLGDQDDEEEGLATGDRAPVPGLPNLNLPSKKTVTTEKAAEVLLECLEVGEAYALEFQESGGKAQPPPIMSVYKVNTPEDFLFETVRRIRSSELEEAILLLPWKFAVRAIDLLPSLLERGDAVELVCRLCVFIIRIHHASIVANHTLHKRIIQIQSKATMKLAELRDVVGFNIHALKWLARDLEATEGEALFTEQVSQHKKRDKRKRTRQAAKRPIITVT